MIVNNIFLTQDVSSIAPENLKYLGLLITANKPCSGIPGFIINDGAWWMLDNGAFTKAGFIEQYWEEWLDIMREQDIEVVNKCICVVIPDVVGDANATLNQFHKYNKIPKAQGFNTAFVTQDGLTVDMVPWDDFDVLFIGGTDHHKMGIEAGYLIDEGLKRDKHIHVGRVNTGFRIMRFWTCHTWDGTALTIKPEKYEDIIINGVKAVIEKKKQPTLF